MDLYQALKSWVKINAPNTLCLEGHVPVVPAIGSIRIKAFFKDFYGLT